MPRSSYPPIAEYAIVGDCHTAALVAADGSVDWLCPRRFDAPAAFCRVLDVQRGGYFRSTPKGRYSNSRRHVDGTNVLETEFVSGEARVRMTDLMPGAPALCHGAPPGCWQLDIYEEVLRAAALHYWRQHHAPREGWPILRGLVEQAAVGWQASGHGIWKDRGGPAQFTYGKLLCWAALDAGVKLARTEAERG